MRYAIYHDESKESAFYHCLFFVPIRSRHPLVAALRTSRANTKCAVKRLSVKDLKPSKTKRLLCAISTASIVKAACQQTKSHKMEYYRDGSYEVYDPLVQRGSKGFSRFANPPACKLVIFRNTRKFADMGQFHRDEQQKLEVTLRMAIEAGVSDLFSKESPVEISEIVLDGEDHYRLRNLDKKSVVDRLLRSKRDRGLRHFTIASDLRFTGSELNDDDIILLDATDIALGAIRYGVEEPWQSQACQAAQPCRAHLSSELSPLMELLARHPAGQRHSRFRAALWARTCEVTGDKWEYVHLHPEFLSESSSTNTQQDSFL